ncbi:hypothetical protein AC067_08205 [Escherichia coli]|nr:hypothetical protein AC067_08205 [Escherichia coli]
MLVTVKVQVFSTTQHHQIHGKYLGRYIHTVTVKHIRIRNISGYTENQKRGTAARKTKKATQLRSLINCG